MDERSAVDRVLASGRLVQGPEVAAFEAEFSELVDARPCVAVNSGTSALHLGLVAAGVGPGDEVIVPSFTYAATANAVALTGAAPVFVDIEPSQFGVDPAAVAAAVTHRTAGILVVHLFGHPVDIAGLQAVADRHGLALFEDACQSHGTTWRGRPVGTFGTFAAFSFYPTKNMTTGDGGMVVLADDALARRVRLLRSHGTERRDENEVVGYNVRMTDIAAAIGRAQLQKLPGWTEQRRAHATALGASLAGVLAPPAVAADATHVYHQYTVRVDGPTDRDTVQTRLTDAGVETGVYYRVPCHRLPSFNLPLHLPETERAAREVLSLPVHPALTAAQLAKVAKETARALGATPRD